MKHLYRKKIYLKAFTTVTALSLAFIFTSFSNDPEYTLPEVVKQYTTNLSKDMITLDNIANDFSY